MMDYTLTLEKLMVWVNGYKLPLCNTFTDYGKAFDIFEMNALLKSLEMQGVGMQYTKLLRDANPR